VRVRGSRYIYRIGQACHHMVKTKAVPGLARAADTPCKEDKRLL